MQCKEDNKKPPSMGGDMGGGYYKFGGLTQIKSNGGNANVQKYLGMLKPYIYTVERYIYGVEPQIYRDLGLVL